MKARGDFKNEFHYRTYLISYYAGQIMPSIDGGHVQAAETAVRRAQALTEAILAFNEDDDRFDYDREEDEL